MIYTGIGARETPDNVLTSMKLMAKYMADSGHTLRSGGAPGADSAFEYGCDQADGLKEIYLPSKGFNQNPSPLFGSTKEARLMAKDYHPNWANLGNAGRDFMGRNSYQVLGLDLKTYTTFIICWTPGGKTVGGTGQALRIAKVLEIPVFNLGSMSLDEISDKVSPILEAKP
jgi:hypothetical protein